MPYKLKLALPALLCAPLFAADPAPAPAKAPAPTPAPVTPLNQWLREQSKEFSPLDISVNLRLRSDVRDNAGPTDAGSNGDFSLATLADNQNSYQLLRLMPKLVYSNGNFSTTIEARTSYTFGDERYNPTAPGKGLPEVDGPVELHQAFVQWGLGAGNAWQVRVGRQELAYGDQRLVGPSRWNNTLRTFDAAKVRRQGKGWSVDVWTGGVVYLDDNALNRSKSDDMFSGLYATSENLHPKLSLDGYFLSRNVSRSIVSSDWSGNAAPQRMTAPQDIYTLGVRAKTKPKALGNWDASAEVMYQFGNRTAVFPGTTDAAALVAPRLQHSANAALAQVSYTFTDLPWSPKATVWLSHASGDNDATDSHSGTFQSLFPSGHLLYGLSDLSGLQNLNDLRFTVTAKPHKTLTVMLDTHIQSLDTTSDFWYNGGGAPRNAAGVAVASGRGYRINPTYGASLGNEYSLIVTWAPHKTTQIEAGFSTYQRGDYIKQSLSVIGSRNANFGYVQLTLAF